MKFYEMPESLIAESFRQISSEVAMAVLERRSSTVTLHGKTNRGVVAASIAYFYKRISF